MRIFSKAYNLHFKTIPLQTHRLGEKIWFSEILALYISQTRPLPTHRFWKRTEGFSPNHTFYILQTQLLQTHFMREKNGGFCQNTTLNILQTQLLQTHRLEEKTKDFLKTLHFTSYRHGYCKHTVFKKKTEVLIETLDLKSYRQVRTQVPIVFFVYSKPYTISFRHGSYKHTGSKRKIDDFSKLYYSDVTFTAIRNTQVSRKKNRRYSTDITFYMYRHAFIITQVPGVKKK